MQVVTDVLASVDLDCIGSQRESSAEFGMALGIVDAYPNRCLNEGLRMVSEAPVRRHMCYVTPRGFAEKSQLTAEYLSWSFSFFRLARRECGELLNIMTGYAWRCVALVGLSELTEIAIFCMLHQRGAEVRSVVDQSASQTRIVGVSVVTATCEFHTSVEAWVIAAISGAQGPDAEMCP